MTRFSACHTLSQNFFLGGKDKLAGAALTEDNNTTTVSRAPTLAAAVVLPVVFAFSFMAQYLEDDF